MAALAYSEDHRHEATTEGSTNTAERHKAVLRWRHEARAAPIVEHTRRIRPQLRGETHEHY